MAELQSQILNNVMLTTYVANADQVARFVNDSVEEIQNGMPDMEKLGISYVSTENEKKILLSYDGAEIGSLDASEFVKDGMVSSVSYDEESRVLAIRWNADAGRPDEEIRLSGLADAYTAGEGLSLDNGEFSLTARIPENVSELSNDAGYLVPENVKISYDGEERRIVLSSGNAVTSIDCGDFVKDGMISAVSYDEATHVLTITWNSDGDAKVTEVNLSGLIDTYTAGEGLSLNGGEFSVNAELLDEIHQIAHTAVSALDTSENALEIATAAHDKAAEAHTVAVQANDTAERAHDVADQAHVIADLAHDVAVQAHSVADFTYDYAQ